MPRLFCGFGVPAGNGGRGHCDHGVGLTTAWRRRRLQVHLEQEQQALASVRSELGSASQRATQTVMLDMELADYRQSVAALTAFVIPDGGEGMCACVWDEVECRAVPGRSRHKERVACGRRRIQLV